MLPHPDMCPLCVQTCYQVVPHSPCLYDAVVFCVQVPLYAVNQHLVVDKLKALDVGGSITIHAFGAYYGLAASMVLSTAGSGVEHRKNGASYTSDMTAMIGTIFLWLFWVSTTFCAHISTAFPPAPPISPPSFAGSLVCCLLPVPLSHYPCVCLTSHGADSVLRFTLASVMKHLQGGTLSMSNIVVKPLACV